MSVSVRTQDVLFLVTEAPENTRWKDQTLERVLHGIKAMSPPKDIYNI